MNSESRPFTVGLILLALLVLVVSPSLMDGWQQLAKAERSYADGQYQSAAQEYGLAARRLPWRGDLWDRAGRSSFQAGEVDQAISLLLQARRRDALTPDGRLILGDAYWQLGKREAALAEWTLLRVEKYDSVALYERLARVYDGEMPVPSQAIAVYRSLLTLDPQNAHAHFRLGLLLAAQDPSQALQELTRAEQLDPSFDHQGQVMLLALNAALLQDNPAYRAVLAGRALGLLGEWNLAQAAFERAIRSDPNYSEAWAFLGEARGHLGLGGLNELDRALTLNPASVSARVMRGLYWKSHDRIDLALIDFRVAAGLEPDEPAWQSILADTLAQSGDLQKAFSVYQNAATIKPDNPVYWRLLAAFCTQYNFEQETGLLAAQKAVKLSPEDPQSLDVLGWTYLQLGQPINAEQYLKQALEYGPQSSTIHLHLGVLYLQKGQYEFARLQLEQAVTLAGDDPSGQQAKQLLSQYFP